MTKYKLPMLGLGITGIVALAIALSQDRTDLSRDIPSTEGSPPTIEERLPKQNIKQRYTHRKKQRQILRRASILYQGAEQQDPSTQLEQQPSPENLYRLFGKNLEAVCYKEIRRLHDGYQPEDRVNGDLYVSDNSQSLTLHRVENPEYPIIADPAILAIRQQEDGTYLLESAQTFLDEHGSAQPYLVINGTADEIRTRLGPFVEWQDTIDAYSREVARMASNGTTPEENISIYASHISALRDIARDNNIPIDPYAWTVMQGHIDMLKSVMSSSAGK